VPVGSAVSLVIERAGAPPLDLRGEVVRVQRVRGQAEAGYDVGVCFPPATAAAAR
jgi:hypothetical protein